MRSVILVRGLLAIMLLLVLGALPGCGEKEQAQDKPATSSKKDVKKEAKEAFEATKAYTQEQMKAFLEETETRLAEYKKEIDQLEAKAETLGGDAKAKLERQMTALHQKRDEVYEKVKDLSSSSGNAWDQIKSGVDDAMKDLASAYKEAVAEFSNP